MNWYLAPLKKYASFSGRARRKEFFIFALINAVVYGALAGIGIAMETSWLTIVAFVFALAMVLPGLAVTVRRLHDTGRSGAWYFITFVPFIGGIWLLALLLAGGQQGNNAYGMDPKAVTA